MLRRKCPPAPVSAQVPGTPILVTQGGLWWARGSLARPCSPKWGGAGPRLPIPRHSPPLTWPSVEERLGFISGGLRGGQHLTAQEEFFCLWGSPAMLGQAASRGHRPQRVAPRAVLCVGLSDQYQALLIPEQDPRLSLRVALSAEPDPRPTRAVCLVSMDPPCHGHLGHQLTWLLGEAGLSPTWSRWVAAGLLWKRTGACTQALTGAMHISPFSTPASPTDSCCVMDSGTLW